VNRPARVLFVTPSLKGGGAERVLVTLLGHLDPARFEPVLATFFEGNDYPQLLPQSVRHIDFRCSGRLAFPRLCRRLARAICEERPDLVVSFMNYTNLVAIVAAGLARIDVPVIIVEQTPLALHFGNKRSLGRRFRRAGARWLYPRARSPEQRTVRRTVGAVRGAGGALSCRAQSSGLRSGAPGSRRCVACRYSG